MFLAEIVLEVEMPSKLLALIDRLPSNMQQIADMGNKTGYKCFQVNY